MLRIFNNTKLEILQYVVFTFIRDMKSTWCNTRFQKTVISQSHIHNFMMLNIKNISQIAVAKQFAGHLAHNVEFLVANTTDTGGPGLQPEDDRYSLCGGRFEIHRTGPHRRRWHDIHILPRDFNEVRECTF